MGEKIDFIVNGVERSFEFKDGEKLIAVLRDRLGLMGTKRGCDSSVCGSCVVAVNGKAIKSCAYPAKKLKGATVTTIEGLADGKELHPIQRAFVESGSIQCGYCIPGMIMELYALFTNDIDAPKKKILKALEKHLCRCTGYEAIIDGAMLAQKYMQEATAHSKISN